MTTRRNGVKPPVESGPSGIFAWVLFADFNGISSEEDGVVSAAMPTWHGKDIHFQDLVTLGIKPGDRVRLDDSEMTCYGRVLRLRQGYYSEGLAHCDVLIEDGTWRHRDESPK